MEILQTAGLVSISEGNRYDSILTSLRSVLSIQRIAAVHGAFQLELIDKNSWDFVVGIPQWLIASAGGFALPKGNNNNSIPDRISRVTVIIVTNTDTRR